MAIYGVYGILQSAGFAATGFLEPVDLTATGTYTLLVAPNSGTGSGTVTVYDVSADFTGPIVSGTAVSVPQNMPGQNARLSYSGTATHRACVALTSTSIPGGTLQLLGTDGAPAGSVGFTTAVGFLDTVPLPNTGTYT